jgi:hypothetical protein
VQQQQQRADISAGSMHWLAWQAAVEWPGRNVMMIDDHSGVTVRLYSGSSAPVNFTCVGIFSVVSAPCHAPVVTIERRD